MRWRLTSCHGAIDAMQISWIIWRFKNCYISLFQQSGRGVTHYKLAKLAKQKLRETMFEFCLLFRAPLDVFSSVPYHKYPNTCKSSFVLELQNAVKFNIRRRMKAAALCRLLRDHFKAFAVGARCCDNLLIRNVARIQIPLIPQRYS